MRGTQVARTASSVEAGDMTYERETDMLTYSAAYNYRSCGGQLTRAALIERLQADDDEAFYQFDLPRGYSDSVLGAAGDMVERVALVLGLRLPSDWQSSSRCALLYRLLLEPLWLELLDGPYSSQVRNMSEWRLLLESGAWRVIA